MNGKHRRSLKTVIAVDVGDDVVNGNQAVWRTCLHLALGNLLNIYIFNGIWLFLLVYYAS